jgi:hypothetical protein
MPCKLLALLAALAAGCAAYPGRAGPLVTAYRPDEGPKVTPAPYAATYALYREKPSGEDSLVACVPARPPDAPWVERGLHGKEPVGFEKGQHGELLAVAGQEKLPLPGEATYSWHITPETQRPPAALAVDQAEEALTTVARLPVLGMLYLSYLVRLLHGGEAGG